MPSLSATAITAAFAASQYAPLGFQSSHCPRRYVAHTRMRSSRGTMYQCFRHISISGGTSVLQAVAWQW